MAISLLPSWSQEYQNHSLTGNRVEPNLKMFVYLFVSNTALKPNMSKLWIFSLEVSSPLLTSLGVKNKDEFPFFLIYFLNLKIHAKLMLFFRNKKSLCMKNATEAGLLCFFCFPFLGVVTYSGLLS